MTPEEAIRLLNELFGHIYEGTTLNQDKAILLGIEALKREEHTRMFHHDQWEGLLPGETK
jgi:hypothetical protein